MSVRESGTGIKMKNTPRSFLLAQTQSCRVLTPPACTRFSLPDPCVVCVLPLSLHLVSGAVVVVKVVVVVGGAWWASLPILTTQQQRGAQAEVLLALQRRPFSCPRQQAWEASY